MPSNREYPVSTSVATASTMIVTNSAAMLAKTNLKVLFIMGVVMTAGKAAAKTAFASGLGHGVRSWDHVDSYLFLVEWQDR